MNLDPDALQRVSGPSWQPLRSVFVDISEKLLAVDPEASGQLTTIYVKYQIVRNDQVKVYAVAWLKKSSEIVVGLALPTGISHPRLSAAPAGKQYTNLTSYFTVAIGESVPAELPKWAKLAVEAVGS